MIDEKKDFDELVQEAIVDLYEIDISAIAPDETVGIISRYANEPNELGKPIVFNGKAYNLLPIKITGVEDSVAGVSARPVLQVANADGLVGATIYKYRGLRGAKITRIRVLKSSLDAINFEGGVNESADPNSYIATIYSVVNSTYDSRLASITLASPTEVEGVTIPLSTILTNSCRFKYRDHRCGYDGHAVADIKGYAIKAHELEKDRCNKTKEHCEARFGRGTQLPFGAFPMADKTGR